MFLSFSMKWKYKNSKHQSDTLGKWAKEYTSLTMNNNPNMRDTPNITHLSALICATPDRIAGVRRASIKPPLPEAVNIGRQLMDGESPRSQEKPCSKPMARPALNAFTLSLQGQATTRKRAARKQSLKLTGISTGHHPTHPYARRYCP